jgi:D-lactate dehydrogenase
MTEIVRPNGRQQGMAGNRSLVKCLEGIVGRRHVIRRQGAMRRFVTGFRTGGGSAVAVVRPGSLVELWQVLKACVDADQVIIMQAANTGLTGGSTPSGDYDRGVIVINTLRLDAIHVIRRGEQVVCLPGATLHGLEARLSPLGREPHSVIGSSCIGASVMGGICNNSGGALLQRGPAYTELALFARVDEHGSLTLENELGIALGNSAEEILTRVETGDFTDVDIRSDSDRIASDIHYADHVRQIDEPTPARFNADPRCLFETSGCAGKLAVFAVRLDTFVAAQDTATFYIGTNDPGELTALRRDILRTFVTLPVSGEYIHRDAFDLTARYGKDTVLAIERLGSSRLPALFALQARINAMFRWLPGVGDSFSDHALYRAARCFPEHLPARMRAFSRNYQHHLVLKMAGDGIAEAAAYLGRRFSAIDSDFFRCTSEEASKAFLHRFAVAGAAIRYRNIHRGSVSEIVALDVALRRNDPDWAETLPPELEAQILHKLYYGHFFCHVFHQDYVLRPGCDPARFKQSLMEIFATRGAQCPAEHNFGHLYHAPPDLAGHYRSLDPGNIFNPGIGETSRDRHWH